MLIAYYSVQFMYFAKVKYIILEWIEDGKLAGEPRKKPRGL